MSKLRKVAEKRWIGGVCAGLAYYLGAPTWLVRLGWTLLVLSLGVGVLAYLLLWIFLPEWENMPKDFYEVTGE